MTHSITKICYCGLRFITDSDERMCFFCTHDSLRRVPDPAERRRTRETAWRIARAGHIRRVRAQWRARNRERLREYNREYMRRYNHAR
jgi:hypothetical protein